MPLKIPLIVVITMHQNARDEDSKLSKLWFATFWLQCLMSSASILFSKKRQS